MATLYEIAEFSGYKVKQVRNKLGWRYERFDYGNKIYFGRIDGTNFVRDDVNHDLLFWYDDYIIDGRKVPYYLVPIVCSKDLIYYETILHFDELILFPERKSKTDIDDISDVVYFAVNDISNQFVRISNEYAETLEKVDFGRTLCRKEDVVVFDGEKLSKECLEEETFVCKNCGERRWKKDICLISDGEQQLAYYSLNSVRGEYLCDKCIEKYRKDDKYFRVSNCPIEAYVKKSLGFLYYGKWYTKYQRLHNFQKSDFSGRLVLADSLYPVNIGDYSIKYGTKGEIKKTPNIVKLKDITGATYYCSKEITEEIDGKLYISSTYPIYEYHDSDVKFHPIYLTKNNTIRRGRKDDGKTYYGFEIETEGNRSSSVYLVNSIGDLVVCEDDGSLNNGYEIISQPMTFECLEYLLPKFDEAFKKIKENGQSSDGQATCGLHIHVSKSAFNDKNAIMKAVAIVSYFRDNIEIFSRRKENRYCTYDKITYKEEDLKRLNKASVRHAAVNTKNLSNRKTIEFRTFSGTLDTLNLMASVEFVRNIVEEANKTKNTVNFASLLKGKYIEEYIRRNNLEFDLTSKVKFSNWYCNDEDSEEKMRHLK